MKLHRRRADRGPRPWLSAAPAALAGLAYLACAPGGGTPGEEAGEGADTMAAAETAMAAGATAQEAPACRFTAAGEELTGRASPPDSATVELGGQTVKLCYSAPSMRGRTIMGDLVPYGEPWRMGANEPTTLHVPFAAEVGTVRVEPGSYALYAVPGESEWTIVVNAAPDRWGIPIDEEVRAQDVGSFAVQPEALEQPVERLAIRMEPGEGGAANVVVEWANTRVSFPIRPAEG
ncbi:MAG: DUF2911 domain-containing protein [Gemmatimonadota bacterium]